MRRNGSIVAWIGMLALAGGVVQAGARSEPDAWKAVAASGRVEASPSAETADWKAVARGDTLAGRSAVRTGSASKATLTRGADILIVDPQSQVVLPASYDASTVEQTSGTVVYEVDGRVNPDFKVVTPYLVAGVKGTLFVVTVGPRSASVAVRHGVVEVSDPTSGERLALGAGEAVLRESGRPGLDRVKPEALRGTTPQAEARQTAQNDDAEEATEETTDAQATPSALASRAPAWFDSWPVTDAHGQAARRVATDVAADAGDTIASVAAGTDALSIRPSSDDARASDGRPPIDLSLDPPVVDVPPVDVPGVDLPIDAPPVVDLPPVHLPPVVDLPPIDVPPAIGLPPIDIGPVGLPPVGIGLHLAPAELPPLPGIPGTCDVVR
jgi:hypothetical protein